MSKPKKNVLSNASESLTKIAEQFEELNIILWNVATMLKDLNDNITTLTATLSEKGVITRAK